MLLNVLISDPVIHANLLRGDSRGDPGVPDPEGAARRLRFTLLNRGVILL
jgi:hypothetical protein